MSPTFDVRALFGGIFLPTGLLCLVLASGLGVSNARLLKNGVRRPGTVISIQRSTSSKGSAYYPIVRFTTPDGQSHEIRSNFSSNPPAYDVGEAVGVIYEANKPDKASIESFLGLWMGPLIAGGIGAIFSAIGAYGLGTYLQQKRLRSWLQQNGTRVPTKVIAIEQNTRIAVNRQHPFQIVSEGTTPFQTGPQTFRSQNIWVNPSTLAPIGSSIDVLVDANNSTRYWMDISPVLMNSSLPLTRR